MPDVLSFRRREKKYLLPIEEGEAFLRSLGDRISPDKHGKSTVLSLYLDTDDYRMIRASLDCHAFEEAYKEKIRLRSYGIPRADSRVFLEIKKKFLGVGSKRREFMTMEQAEEYISSGTRPQESQIMRELDYAMHCHGELSPKILVACERTAYVATDNGTLRLTLDSHVRYRREKLSPREGSEGKLLLPENMGILEVKDDGVMPFWLSLELDRAGFHSRPFSKVGHAYEDALKAGTL